MKIPLASVVFREDLYPRIKTDPLTVQKYAEDLEVLPPIEVNQHFELIDGWHRWTAHKKQQAETIEATVIQTSSDSHLLELAIERNASHGLQLSQEDKQSMARRIYNVTPERERDAKKKQLAKVLSVSERTVRDWLSRIDKDSKAARNKRIFAAWLACDTQEEIAERESVSRMDVSRVCNEMAELPESYKPAASHLTDFDPPLYNVWKQQTKSSGSNHFGNSEPRWVDNLLYLYTKPFDIVVDPFAGGGSTIDVCRKRYRRYWVADRKPVPEREREIRTHDLVDLESGTVRLPELNKRWSDVRLVYLDPPYWKQAEGRYSQDSSDLANMELVDFTKWMVSIIGAFSKKLSSGAFLATIIQPTQWKAPDRAYTDHVADLIRNLSIPLEMRFSVPYESQQCNAQMVEWAKSEKRCLVLTREIVVWRVE